MFVFWYIFFSLVGIAIYYKSIVSVLILIIFGISTIIISKLLKKKKIEEIKLCVQQLKNKEIKRPDIEVNVNKNGWEIIQELPGFNRIAAKRVVSIRRKMGKYSSIDDFFVKNNVKDEYKKILKKIIVVK